MDAWERLYRDEQEALSFLLGEEFREMYLHNGLPIVIVCEDELIHTDSHPYCSDPTCPCMAEFDEAYTRAAKPEDERCLEFPTDDAPWLSNDF